MKKILYAITKSNFGGAQRYVYELALEAQKSGYNVHVACGGNGLLVTKLKEAGIPVHQIDGAARDIHLLKEFRSLASLYRIIRDVQPDIVHLNSPKLGGLGSLAARACKVPDIVYTNHGWPFMEKRPQWQISLIKFFSWLTMMLCHRIIVLTRKELDMAKHWPGAKKAKNRSKFIVIPIGIDPKAGEGLMQQEEALISLLGEEKAIELIKRNARIVGNISELHKNKGYEYAIEGFKQYKDHVDGAFNSHFIIIGEGELRSDLERQIARLGLQNDVTLLGFVKDARAYVKAFNLLLFTSLKEGLPYVLLETGIASVPIASTDVGGIPELIENLSTGFLIRPGNPQEIKNILTYIDDHPGEDRQYAETFKQKLTESYSLQSQMQKTFLLYQDIDRD